jgi:hypothetical protein
VIPATLEAWIGDSESMTNPRQKSETLFKKQLKQKRARGVIQEEEICLAIVRPTANPSTTKKKTRKRKKKDMKHLFLQTFVSIPPYLYFHLHGLSHPWLKEGKGQAQCNKIF